MRQTIFLLAIMLCPLWTQISLGQSCSCGEPVCGCEENCCEPECGCEPCCDSECDSMGCDGCGGGGAGGCCFGASGDDPFKLFNCCECLDVGGWVQMGYHSRDAGNRFNSRGRELQLQQGWLYAEKAIDTSDGFDIGGRIDYIYGTDGPDTQAFGPGDDHWDNDWDHGNDYGHAIPQLYAEVGYGCLSVKLGHFYTIIGWEVVTAPDNFFYSHAYTMYNSEPFTHTGALASWSCSDGITVYGGYTLGWDSGFKDNGDNFIGGISASVCEDITLTYATVAGRFNSVGLGESGYMHSLVADVALTDCLQYVFQTDYLDTDNSAGTQVRNTYGINQYWIYNINDCVAGGVRFEWWQTELPTGVDRDVFDLTCGINVRPHANVIVRPEIRWDWDDSTNPVGINAGNASNQTTFGIDSIVLF